MFHSKKDISHSECYPSQLTPHNPHLINSYLAQKKNMEQGWDPEVKNFFRKIINTISFGLLWMMATATAGIYFKLGWQDGRSLIPVILFYVIAITALFLLLRYYYRLWKK